MAQFTGPDVSELPGWRIGLIFLLFCIISVVYDFGVRALDNYLKRHKKRALRHVVKRLQGELLVLGLLSLLLVSFEGYLLRICIGCSGSSCAWNCPQQQEPPTDAAANGRRRRLLAALLGDGTISFLHGGGISSGAAGPSRTLLASEATDELSCMQAAETCPPGSEPFWSQLAMVQAHMFLFVIAAVHILYACVSMLLCTWKLRRWQRYERDARQLKLRPLNSRSRFLPRPSDNALTHFLRCTASLFVDSVNADVYCGLRRLFIERLDVDASFDFHGFLVESMEEEFAGIVGVNSLLWCIVLLWIMLPPESYQLVWLSALAVVGVFVVAVKLQSIITCLADEAYQLYGCTAAHPQLPSEHDVTTARQQQPASSLHGSRGVDGIEGVPASANSTANHFLVRTKSSPPQHVYPACLLRNGAPFDKQQQRQWKWHPLREQQRHLEHASYTPYPGGERGNADLRHDDSAAGLLPSARSGNGREEDGGLGQGGEEAAATHALPGRGVPLSDAFTAAATAGAVAQHQAEAWAASVVQQGRAAGAASDTGSHAVEHRAGAEQQQVKQEQQVEEVEEGLGGELSVDLEAQAQRGQAARVAADTASRPHPTSSVFRRCCPWLLPRLPWPRKQQAQRVQRAVQRSQSFSETYIGPDAAGLFWFGRPRLMLRIIQAIYFENSLSVAALLFSVWQGVDLGSSPLHGGLSYLLSTIAVELLVLLFVSLLVLPVYALTTAAGSHSAESVIRHALKKNIKPDVARALQQLSMQLPGETVVEEEPVEDDEESHDGYVNSGVATTVDHQVQDTIAAAVDRAPASAAEEAQHGGPVGGAAGTAAAPSLPSRPRGRPSLGRHSAPLPGLHRISPAFAFLPAAGDLATDSGRVTPSGAAERMVGTGSMWQRLQPQPDMGQRFDPAALAAAAAAAAVQGPTEDDGEESQSITRLMGAMYKKQLQRHLERASASRPGQGPSPGSAQRPPHTSAHGEADADGSRGSSPSAGRQGGGQGETRPRWDMVRGLFGMKDGGPVAEKD